MSAYTADRHDFSRSVPVWLWEDGFASDPHRYYAALRAQGPVGWAELAPGVSAYVVTAKLLTKIGATDLAMLAADRAANKAIEAGSDVARGMSAYQVVCALMRADRSDDAEHLAVTMAEQLHNGARSDLPAIVSLAGALWLIGAIIAASAPRTILRILVSSSRRAIPAWR